MPEITEKQAKALAGSRFWEAMSFRERAEFQIGTPRLCMPFEVFHEAVEKTLGRPVYTHEFGLDFDGIKAEINGERPSPSFEQILELIPEDKRVIMLASPADAAEGGEG